MWTDGNGRFYEGDRRQGDREATPDEVAAWNLSRSLLQVDVERDRRQTLGISFGGKVFQTDPASITNVLGSAQMAALAIADGTGTVGNLRWFDPNRDFGWIAADNSIQTMDAPTVIAFGKAVAAFKAANIFAARMIKNDLLAGISVDVATDPRWPATP
jgi:hypothetical protein